MFPIVSQTSSLNQTNISDEHITSTVTFRMYRQSVTIHFEMKHFKAESAHAGFLLTPEWMLIRQRREM